MCVDKECMLTKCVWTKSVWMTKCMLTKCVWTKSVWTKPIGAKSQQLLSRRHCRSCVGSHVRSRYLHWAKKKALCIRLKCSSNHPNLCVSLVCDAGTRSRWDEILQWTFATIDRIVSLLLLHYSKRHCFLHGSSPSHRSMRCLTSQVQNRDIELKKSNWSTHSSNHPNLCVSIGWDDRTRRRCGDVLQASLATIQRNPRLLLLH